MVIFTNKVQKNFHNITARWQNQNSKYGSKQKLQCCQRPRFFQIILSLFMGYICHWQHCTNDAIYIQGKRAAKTLDQEECVQTWTAERQLGLSQIKTLQTRPALPRLCSLKICRVVNVMQFRIVVLRILELWSCERVGRVLVTSFVLKNNVLHRTKEWGIYHRNSSRIKLIHPRLSFFQK